MNEMKVTVIVKQNGQINAKTRECYGVDDIPRFARYIGEDIVKELKTGGQLNSEYSGDDLEYAMAHQVPEQA